MSKVNLVDEFNKKNNSLKKLQLFAFAFIFK